MHESKNVQEICIRWPTAESPQKRTSATFDKSFVAKMRVVINNKIEKINKEVRK